MAESAPSQSNTELPEEIAQQWARTRLAHEAVMLQDAAETLRLDRARTQAHQREFLGPSWSDPQGGEVIHIGDVHQAQPLPVAAAVPVATPAPSSRLATFAKLALGAGLIASGAGIPAGAMIVASAIKDRVATPAATAPEAPAVNPQTTVKPNIYGLELVPPK